MKGKNPYVAEDPEESSIFPDGQYVINVVEGLDASLQSVVPDLRERQIREFQRNYVENMGNR